MIFDEMGLAEFSPDNPLKAIHEPLEIKYEKKGHEISFVGISNSSLDLSNMSRLLSLKRTDMSKEELTETAKTISEQAFS
jgi:hypothetical protein